MLSWKIVIIILVLLFITNSVHKKSKGRFSRHHAVNDIIARALNLANFPAMLEPSSIIREDNKRPDGMTNVPWSHGRHPVWDFTCPDTLAPFHLPGHPRSISPARTHSLHFTCPDTLAPSHLPGHPRSISPARTPSLHLTCPDTLAPSHLPGHPRSISPARTHSLHFTCVALLQKLDQQLRKLRKRKVSKYRSIAAYHTFIPVAVETLGPMGPEAKSFLLDLGRRLRQHTGEPRSTSYLIYTADLNGDPEGQCCCHDGVTATREGTGQTATIVILHAIVLSIVL